MMGRIIGQFFLIIAEKNENNRQNTKSILGSGLSVCQCDGISLSSVFSFIEST